MLKDLPVDATAAMEERAYFRQIEQHLIDVHKDLLVEANRADHLGYQELAAALGTVTTYLSLAACGVTQKIRDLGP